MIREATVADIPAIVAMGCEFLAVSPLGSVLPTNPLQLAALTYSLIDADNATVFVAERDGALVGMFGAVVAPNAISGEPMATEMFWWVAPAARGTVGVHLLKAAEEWARAAGARRLQLGAPTAEAAQLYKRLNYNVVEIVFQKELS